MLFSYGDPFLWFPAAILGHQALEMFLKGALIRAGFEISYQDAWGHDLAGLAEKLAKRHPDFPADLIEQLQTFTNYFDELRYPTKLNYVDGVGEREDLMLDDLVTKLRPYAVGGES